LSIFFSDNGFEKISELQAIDRKVVDELFPNMRLAQRLTLSKYIPTEATKYAIMMEMPASPSPSGSSDQSLEDDLEALLDLERYSNKATPSLPAQEKEWTQVAVVQAAQNEPPAAMSPPPPPPQPSPSACGEYSIAALKAALTRLSENEEVATKLGQPLADKDRLRYVPIVVKVKYSCGSSSSNGIGYITRIHALMFLP